MGNRDGGETFGLETLLKEMEEYAAVRHVPIINEQERSAFCRIVQDFCPHRILEIGTAIGYSALLLARCAADDACVTTLERSEERAEQAQKYIARSPYASCIKIHVGDAGKLLQQENIRAGAPYDLVFIDAAKGQYPDYFAKALPLLADHAVLLADNVLFRGYVRSEQKIPHRYRTMVNRLREYLCLAAENPGCHTDILENGDGLAVTRWDRTAEASTTERGRNHAEKA